MVTGVIADIIDPCAAPMKRGYDERINEGNAVQDAMTRRLVADRQRKGDRGASYYYDGCGNEEGWHDLAIKAWAQDPREWNAYESNLSINGTYPRSTVVRKSENSGIDEGKTRRGGGEKKKGGIGQGDGKGSQCGAGPRHGITSSPDLQIFTTYMKSLRERTCSAIPAQLDRRWSQGVVTVNGVMNQLASEIWLFLLLEANSEWTLRKANNSQYYLAEPFRAPESRGWHCQWFTTGSGGLGGVHGQVEGIVPQIDDSNTLLLKQSRFLKRNQCYPGP
ncbi:hypothetical protein EI94DRAFT_1701093 [Lactarius quietus]|nr:hypothetical protein EI94DRAFT_1701093 [Lactarius quietus]